MSSDDSAEVTQKTSNVLSGGLLEAISPHLGTALRNTIGDTDDESDEGDECRGGLAPVQEGFDDYADWDDGDDGG